MGAFSQHMRVHTALTSGALRPLCPSPATPGLCARHALPGFGVCAPGVHVRLECASGVLSLRFSSPTVQFSLGVRVVACSSRPGACIA
eukprot:scaffold290442_cov13-Tisochrysis_lutea.AAC.1